MSKSRADEITDAMLAKMTLQGIPPSVPNQISFLQGLREGWMKEPDGSFEKSLYLLALNGKIAALQILLMRISL